MASHRPGIGKAQSRRPLPQPWIVRYEFAAVKEDGIGSVTGRYADRQTIWLQIDMNFGTGR